MKQIFFIITFLLAAVPVMANCGDDPRLKNLPEILASGSMPEKPFYLLPETFIRLQPAARKALGNSIVICPGNPVRKGAPVHPSRLSLDFGVIWQVMEEAINMNDWESVQYLHDYTIPAELEPEAAFSLLVFPPLSRDDIAKLGKIIDLPKDSFPVFLADIFTGLGGKSRKATVYYSSYSGGLDKVRSIMESRDAKDVFFQIYSDYDRGSAIASMARIGIEMIPAWRVR